MYRASETRRAAAALLLGLGWGASAAADVLVLRSQGAGVQRQYKVGARLADNAAVRIAAGERLLLLDGKGVRDLTGPMSIRLDDPAVPSRPMALMAFDTQRRDRLAGTRAFSGNANILRLDVAEPQCLIAAWPTFVLRGGTGRASYKLTWPGGEGATLTFDGGEPRTLLPRTVSARVEGPITVTDAASGATATVRPRWLTGNPTGNVEIASLYLAQGCGQQIVESTGVE